MRKLRVQNNGTSPVVIKDHEGYSTFVMEVPPSEVRIQTVTYDVLERLQTQLNAVPTLSWSVLDEPFITKGDSDWQNSVKTRTGTPPGSPAIGDRYLITTGTGAWLSKNDNITEWDGLLWLFFSPAEGMTVWVEDENAQYMYEDGAWKLSSLPARSYNNTTRPNANTVIRGTSIFNTDDSAPNWSDGAAWRDADGNLT